MRKIVVAAALSAAIAAPALADVVTFDDLAVATSTVYATPLTSGGFNFDANPGHQMLVWGADYSQYNADDAGATLSTQTGYSTVTASKVGGGSFTLNSIDFDDIYDSAFGTDGTIQVVFNYALGGSSSQVISIDALAGFETFIFDVTGLSSVDITSANTLGGLFQMDNLTWSKAETTQPSPTPEPASWAMMLLGFGAVGAAMRRRTSIAFA